MTFEEYLADETLIYPNRRIPTLYRGIQLGLWRDWTWELEIQRCLPHQVDVRAFSSAFDELLNGTGEPIFGVWEVNLAANNIFTFRFSDARDAVMFKLRWG